MDGSPFHQSPAHPDRYRRAIQSACAGDVVGNSRGSAQSQWLLRQLARLCTSGRREAGRLQCKGAAWRRPSAEHTLDRTYSRDWGRGSRFGKVDGFGRDEPRTSVSMKLSSSKNAFDAGCGGYSHQSARAQL
jgi:hypothetical protein